MVFVNKIHNLFLRNLSFLAIKTKTNKTGLLNRLNDSANVGVKPFSFVMVTKLSMI